MASYSPVNCRGGLNVESSYTAMPAGEAVALINVEVDVAGTYTTMAGIEKYDGRDEPQKANYLMLTLSGNTGITLGATITAVPSGWYSVVVGIDGNNIAVLEKTASTATCTTSDTILGNAVIYPPTKSEARTYDLHCIFRRSTQAATRAPITAVPGVNQVRGVVIYKNTLYAFRDHADGVTCRMYKATSAGWVEVTTSGFLLKNGTYKFIVHNFKASAGTPELIIVNGVNKAVKFNGTTCVQISTGMPVDTPSSANVLPSSVLLLGYANGSVMTSKIGDPTDFTVLSGGAELGMSDKVIDIAVQPDGKVAIFCERQIKILSGKTPASFDLSTFASEVGAISGSVSNIGDSIFVSQIGVTRLVRVQGYGDFEMVGIDRKIKRLINKSDISFSLSVKSKNQYRLYNSTGFVGFTFSGQEVIGAFLASYPVKMTCGCTDYISGEECIFTGAADGFVYRCDVGQSHAGASFDRLARLAWDAVKSPNFRKKFKRLEIFADSQRIVPAKIGIEYDYSSGDNLPQAPFDISAGGNETYYGFSTYGNAIFGASSDSINHLYNPDVARSIAIFLLLSSDIYDPIRFSGYLLEYEMRSKVK
jgi:hypothetical protein